MQQYVFKRHKVQAVLKQALRDRMEGQQYDPVKAAQVPECTACVLCLLQQLQLVADQHLHNHLPLLCSMQSNWQMILGRKSRPWDMTGTSLWSRSDAWTHGIVCCVCTLGVIFDVQVVGVGHFGAKERSSYEGGLQMLMGHTL